MSSLRWWRVCDRCMSKRKEAHARYVKAPHPPKTKDANDNFNKNNLKSGDRPRDFMLSTPNKTAEQK